MASLTFWVHYFSFHMFHLLDVLMSKTARRKEYPYQNLTVPKYNKLFPQS